MEPAGEYSSVHDAYVACGPEQYYKKHGRDYRNPHEPVIVDLIARIARDWPIDFSRVLDLAAGSGEVTRAVLEIERASHPLNAFTGGTPVLLNGIDPYTSDAYHALTGQACETITFEQISAGALRGRSYSVVICSFAMHLVAPSRLPALCWALAEVSGRLLILTPHKRPILREEWGWVPENEMVYQRVRARLYARAKPE